MNTAFGFQPQSIITDRISSGVEALEMKSEVWFIPPHDAPKQEEDYGDYSNAMQLIKDIKLDRGLRHWADLTGTFIAGDFIEALFANFNIHTKCLYVDHYVLSQNNIDSFALLLNKGYVDRIELMISDFWFRSELHELVPYIYDKLKGNGRFQMGVSRTHKKLVAFQTDNNTHAVIHGSANLRSCDCDEHLMIEDNKNLYNRLVPRIQRKIARYRTINEVILERLEAEELTRKEASNLLRKSRSLTRKETWQVDQESTCDITMSGAV